ncbi:MAG: hypothetical protein GYB16_13545 [Gammaproteobacteria bacterium]|nr:hypothetical protein [Gammaproteobacteria bacterium]
MKNQQHQLTVKSCASAQPVTLVEEQLFDVSGGPVEDRGPKEPVYITLAIGEGGGKLPDILS